MPLKFRKLTKEEERELIVRNLASNLTAIAHNEARLISALEWTMPDELDDALRLMSEENALKIRSLKENLLAAATSR
ncbi:MAG TPA: hypothetical protein DD990_17495 [Cyanobacteria bacterium UBA11368]|nr:hypothetical protein [Cyanobacteria bacterium UBA11368]